MIKRVFITFALFFIIPSAFSDAKYTGFGGSSIQLGVEYEYNLNMTADVGFFSTNDVSSQKLSEISLVSKKDDSDESIVYGYKELWFYAEFDSTSQLNIRVGISGKLNNESFTTSEPLDWSVTGTNESNGNTMKGINLDSSKSSLNQNIFDKSMQKFTGGWQKVVIRTSQLKENNAMGKYSGTISIAFVVGG